MVTNTDLIEAMLISVGRLAADLRRGVAVSEFQSGRDLLQAILSESLITQMYLVDAISNPSTQNRAIEHNLIRRWHNIGRHLICIEGASERLKDMGELLLSWSSSWVSPAVWDPLQNERALKTVNQLSVEARELLRTAGQNSPPRRASPIETFERYKSGETFDVFLAHNAADRKHVEQIAVALKRRGISPWLDKEQIRPGQWFQVALQNVIPNVRSAAIFLGPSGIGKWEALETRTFITTCVESDRPVIPVLLPGVTEIPKNLLLLRELNSVIFSNTVDDDAALDRLQWGITGVKPDNIRES